jgi:hypothetical protein
MPGGLAHTAMTMNDLTTQGVPAMTLDMALARDGFCHMPHPALHDMARWDVGQWDVGQWDTFAASWHDLGPDGYMADGGRYRRRRHGAFLASGTGVTRKAHQPHYQSRDYNPLNGGVQRWFEPMADDVADGAVLRAMFGAVTPVLARMDGRAPDAPWHCEVHQFRIETSPAETGRPTPEGFHRDGVDWVLVVLIARENVGEGRRRLPRLMASRLGSSRCGRRATRYCWMTGGSGMASPRCAR